MLAKDFANSVKSRQHILRQKTNNSCVIVCQPSKHLLAQSQKSLHESNV